MRNASRRSPYLQRMLSRFVQVCSIQILVRALLHAVLFCVRMQRRRFLFQVQILALCIMHECVAEEAIQIETAWTLFILLRHSSLSRRI